MKSTTSPATRKASSEVERRDQDEVGPAGQGGGHAARACRVDAGHQQAELALVGLAGDALAGDAAVEHHDDAVGQRLDLVELDRDEQDRLAPVAQGDDLAGG